VSVNSVVLDASALLALLRKEKGATVVERHLDGAVLSAVNYSEVLKKTVEAGGKIEEAAARIEDLQLKIIPFGERQAATAAGLFPKTRNKGLSLADRACLALALELSLPALTTEERWEKCDTGVKVVRIR
jgi:PIN domain nuclease of toxin-antitoxin system